MVSRQLALGFAFIAIMATPGAPWAGELRASYGSPQLREIWQNTDREEKKVTVEVTAAGGAVCTVSVTGGTTKRYETDDGKPKHDDVTVPGKGKISLTAYYGGVPPKPAKGAAPVASDPTCSYSVSKSEDLSR